MKNKCSRYKFRENDTLDTKGILRLIESVPSPKAKPERQKTTVRKNRTIEEK